MTANIRMSTTTTTTSASTLGPKKLRTLRNFLSRGKRKHLRVRSANSSGNTNNNQSDIIVNNNNNNNNNISCTSAITHSVDAMKVKEREKVKDNKNAGEKTKEVNEDDVKDGVNGETAEKYKSENNLPPATTHPIREKILYDNRIRRKNVLALNEKVAAIREYEKAPVYKRVGRIFHCSPDQIKRIVQQKDSILEAWEQRTRRCHDAKTLEMKVVRVSMLGKAVYDWLRRMIYYQDIQITDGLIQKTALQFKSAMGLQNFFPHQDWCDKFRHTYKIRTADSKMLNIGYTQGYSVQIKDVMKDVLNECTPDAGDNGQLDAIDDDEDDNDDDDEENDDDDDDDDDDVQEINDECVDSEKGKEQQINGDKDSSATTAAVSAKRRRLKSNANQGSSTKNSVAGNTSNVARSSPVAVANTVVNRICVANPNMNTSNASSASNNGNKSNAQPAMRKLTAPQLPHMRQLVALPLQGNVAGMPQKVLVATPITPAGQVPGTKPMTMTIIPLATIAQSQSMQKAASAAVSMNAATTNALTAALATTTATAATPATDAEKSAVPAPIMDIKKEIKQEPVEIKQEYISDAEDDEAGGEQQQQQLQQQQEQQQKETAKQLSAVERLKRNKNNNPMTSIAADGDTSSCSGTDTDDRIASESADDENIALANLRRLIQTQGKIVATASSTGTKSSRTFSVPPLAPRPTLTQATLAPFSAGDRQSLPTSTTAITCIPAANLSAMTRSLSFTPPLPPLTKAPDAVINRLANKRKHPGGNTSIMPPIKTCTEARKYLKLLEDFALVKENFRLIGLITRADEVLRELDGDDDVDVD